SDKPWMGYIKIADGCDNKCSYCAIPLIRGPYRSMDMDALVEEAKRLADCGVKELNLIAQDTTRFGTDTYKKRMLPELLKRMNEIEGLHWIRVLYMYPDEIDDELIDGIKDLKKVLPYFDIPVQHGSDRMLKLMNRRGSIESIRTICERIKRGYDRPVLRTTLITGFPSETLWDHQLTLEMMKEIQWDRLGAFTYSKEEDTPSFEMEDDVPEEEKVRRLNEIMDLQKEIAQAKAASLVGETLEVLVEGYNGLIERYTGRSIYSAPDGVDGEVIFSSNQVLNQGDFVRVKIKRTRGHDLIGEMI
ncbi:MAG: MiaB/RimO family radical SAM methylthiotransferase, partial [Erysipelotrichaceae bacterium]|nr:MiaB/RimO family radical SAM methylthiotransferase [Erysipelotrichaceae bacterium]